MTTELKTKNAKAVIASEGAELKSLVIGGREIMWCGDPAFWGKTSPVLFPAIGNVKNNKTIIDGKEISLTKHGFARDNTFTTVIKSGNSLILQYKYAPVKNGYPYSVELCLQYNLFDDRIEICYSVFNPEYHSIPFCIGAHPAIACDDLDNSRWYLKSVRKRRLRLWILIQGCSEARNAYSVLTARQSCR